MSTIIHSGSLAVPDIAAAVLRAIDTRTAVLATTSPITLPTLSA